MNVSTNTPVVEMSLIRVGSTTHTVNTDQRRVVLGFVPVVDGRTDYRATLPADPGVLVPGVWMLFGIDEGGVPSLGVSVRIAVG